MTSGTNIRRLKTWLLPAMLLLILVIAVAFWLWIPAFLKTTLTEFTHSKTNGKYTLTVDNISRGFFPFSISVQGVNLEPDTTNTIDFHNDNQKLLYRFKAGELRLEGMDILKLFRENRLSVDRIKVTRPEIKLAGNERIQLDSLSASPDFIQSLWPLFERITSVEITKIELEEANFGFYTALKDSDFITKAEKVAIEIHGFAASEAMADTGRNLFTTNDVFLRMNNFSIDMGDNLHESTIDTLFYSLKTTDIKINGFSLLPLQMNPEENLFEVHVPEVYVKSRSITHFALNDSLKISFLQFSNPEIKFFQKNQPQQLAIETIDNFDLYSLVREKFTNLEVDSFFLRGANVEIFRQPDAENYQQQFTSVDVVLHGFDLDSTSYLNKNKLLHADNLEMHVKGYHLKLEDNAHHFEAGSLFASTFSNELNAHDIHIYPETAHIKDLRNEINIECEALMLDDVDFLDLYHNRILPTSKIEVTEPEVHLNYNMGNEKKGQQGDTGLLYDLVTDYLLGAYADTVRVRGGHINIQNNQDEIVKGYFESRINFNLNDFRLDSASVQESSNFFYASNFDLHLIDYNMRLTDDFHSLKVDTISISSYNDQVEIMNIRLQPVPEQVTPEIMKRSGHSELFRINVPKIVLRSVNLRDALFRHTVKIADFSITQPEIYFENFRQFKEKEDKKELSEIYQLLFSYLADIEINKFHINNGMLTWVNHTRNGQTTRFDNEFSASFRNFHLNEAELSKKRLLFSDDFDLTIKDQEFELSDNVHVLKGSEIRFSSAESSIRVKEALLFPMITSNKYLDLTTTWQVAIPEIKIEGFDFHKAYFSQEPEVEYIELVKPRFQVYTQPDKAKGLDLKAYSIPMPSFLESLKITELNINGAEAITYRREGLQHHAMANFYFNLSVPGLMLENDAQEQLSMRSDNIKLSISDFRVPVDEIHNLHIESIDFNRENESIDVTNVELMPFIPNSQLNRFSISAPAIHFNGFDYNAATNENNFTFTNIEATDPVISIEVNKETREESPEFLETLDLYPYVEHLVNAIEIKNFDIRNAHLNVNWLKKQILDNKLSLSFNNILLSENQPPHQILNSSSYSITTSNLSTTSKNKMYEFSIDSVRYTSTGNKVVLMNLNVKPLADKRSFPLMNGYQTEVVNAEIEYVEFNGINERRWLKDNILDARALVIGPAEVDIFRDKRFPFNDNQRPEWPQDLIKNLNQPFIFDSVVLRPSTIRYNELLPIFDEPGYITFTDLTLHGNRLSNIEGEISNNRLFELDAGALLQDQARLKAHFVFDLNSNKYHHSVTGSLSPMPLTALNTMIMKSAPVKVESGQLKQLDFDISFNEDSASGKLFVAYDDLKVAILNYSGDSIEKAGFTSFLANSLKINSQHAIRDDQNPVELNYKRDEKRSVINLWWKSIYSGVQKVIGL